MKRVTLIKLLVEDEDRALEFYTTKLGFEIAEDNTMGGYRWLLVRLPDNQEFCVNIAAAKTEQQRALVGRQAADLPLFSIETDDCRGEYEAMKARGVAFEGRTRDPAVWQGRPVPRQRDLPQPGPRRS